MVMPAIKAQPIYKTKTNPFSLKRNSVLQFTRAFCEFGECTRQNSQCVLYRAVAMVLDFK